MNKKLYEDSIILIGPCGAGKSTIAEELSKKTGMDRLCLDSVANRARQSGLRAEFEKEVKKMGRMELINNPDAFNYFMLSGVLRNAERSDLYGVVDFGAGHSVYKSEEIFEMVKEKLKPFKNVVLLLPDEDIEKSLEIMDKRARGDKRENRWFLESPCNRELATMTVYEKNRQPSEIADEILSRISQKKMQWEGEEL